MKDYHIDNAEKGDGRAAAVVLVLSLYLSVQYEVAFTVLRF